MCIRDRHIWITVDSKTSEGDCFVLRDLILRMYWDGEENPSVEVPLSLIHILYLWESGNQGTAVRISTG